MTRKELLKELDIEFEKIKKELNIKVELDQVDKIFCVKDCVMHYGYVSTNLPSMICSRIIDTFNLWINYLHSLVIPNPSSMINTTESQLFDENERNELIKIMNKILAHTTQNSINILTGNKEKEGEFIDNSVALWEETSKKLLKTSKKINDYWKNTDK